MLVISALLLITCHATTIISGRQHWYQKEMPLPSVQLHGYLHHHEDISRYKHPTASKDGLNPQICSPRFTLTRQYHSTCQEKRTSKTVSHFKWLLMVSIHTILLASSDSFAAHKASPIQWPDHICRTPCIRSLFILCSSLQLPNHCRPPWHYSNFLDWHVCLITIAAQVAQLLAKPA